MAKSSNETNKSKSTSSRAKPARRNNTNSKRTNHNNTSQQTQHVSATATASHHQQVHAGTNSNSSVECTNEFDTVLGEAHDLLGAAAESQALGRLKMANTYLLLLHVRLIGLGKRFDRAILSNPESFSNLSTSTSSVNSNDSPKAMATTTASPKTPNETTTPTKQGEHQDEAAKALAQVLPHGINLDSTMVEHLARAAMELHNKRTGKINRNNHIDDKQPRAVAWSIDEHTKCIEASQKYGNDAFCDIAKAVGTRSEMEVKAHLRNVSSKEKVSEQLLDNTDAGATTAKKKNGGKAKKPPSKAVYTDAYHHFDAKLHLYGI